LDIASSAMTNFMRRPWLLTGTSSRIFRPASPLARRMPRKAEMVATVTTYLRLRLFRSSPRSSDAGRGGQRRGPLRSPYGLPPRPPGTACPLLDMLILLASGQYPRESWSGGIFSECVWWSISLVTSRYNSNVWRYACASTVQRLSVPPNASLSRRAPLGVGAGSCSRGRSARHRTVRIVRAQDSYTRKPCGLESRRTRDFHSLR